MIKSKRQFPDIPHFISLIDWKLPTIFRNRAKVAKALTIEDLAAIAKKKVPKVVYDYVEGSALDEVSYQRSKDVFSRAEFTAHTLRDVSKIDPSTIIYGKKVDLPILFSPTGYTRFMHHVGEPAVAAVAENNNLIYSLSTMGTTSPSELAQAVPGARRWFQLYVMQNREDSLSVIKQAKENGFEALILTVDTPVSGIRVRDIKNGLTVPPTLTLNTFLNALPRPGWWWNFLTKEPLNFAALESWNGTVAQLMDTMFDPSMTYDDLKWIRQQWKGNLVVKGIQNVDDAVKSVSAGADAIILSNHGGRQLDRAPVPFLLLPEVRKKIGKKAELHMDTGIMHGADVLAAVALGAKFTYVGRAYLYGLMAGGQDGVERALEIMQTQMIRNMKLLGVSTLEELTPNHVKLLNRH